MLAVVLKDLVLVITSIVQKPPGDMRTVFFVTDELTPRHTIVESEVNMIDVPHSQQAGKCDPVFCHHPVADDGSLLVW